MFLPWFTLRDERICLACCQFQLGFQGPSTLVGESTSIFKLVPMRIHICQGRNFYTLTHVEANEVEEVRASFHYDTEILQQIKYHNE